jgi:hypothetical protein
VCNALRTVLRRLFRLALTRFWTQLSNSESLALVTGLAAFITSQKWRNFPNDASIVRLVGALLLEHQEEWQLDGRRVFSEISMAKLDNTSSHNQHQKNSCHCYSCLIATLRSGLRPL